MEIVSALHLLPELKPILKDMLDDNDARARDGAAIGLRDKFTIIGGRFPSLTLRVTGLSHSYEI